MFRITKSFAIFPVLTIMSYRWLKFYYYVEECRKGVWYKVSCNCLTRNDANCKLDLSKKNI